MDDESSDHRGKIESVSSTHLVDKGNCENLGNLVHQSAPETAILVKSDEKTALSDSSDNGNSIYGEKSNEPANVLGSSKVSMDGRINKDANISGEKSNGPANVLGSSKVSTDGRNIKDVNDDTHSWVIHINSGGSENVGENFDGERICRICHLSSEPSSSKSPVRTADSAATAPSNVLIQLGCGCKDELGIAHALCAEAWFKLKGNRQCEICGETAKNVTGIVDNIFFREVEEARVSGSVTDMSDSCFQGRTFCNFLLAWLLIALVLPWILHLHTSGSI